MLPKQYRLSSKEVRIVLRRGSFVHFGGLKLVSCALPLQQMPKIGFIVPLRVENQAVGRHKLKRCLREITRLLIHEFIPSNGYVFLVTEKIGTPTTKTLEPIVRQVILLSAKRHT